MKKERRLSEELSFTAEEVAALEEARAARHVVHRSEFDDIGQGLGQATAGKASRRFSSSARQALLTIGRRLGEVKQQVFKARKLPLDTLRRMFDEQWYVVTYPDVQAAGLGGWKHFVEFGIREGRNPNAFFRSDWYMSRYADVMETGLPPIIHYIEQGAAELRDPHPDFDAGWYASEHPQSRRNPLLFHVSEGTRHGYPTRKADTDVASSALPHAVSGGAPQLAVSVVIPVYRGLQETKACLESVLADGERPPGEIIVVDDCSPEPELSRWLETLAGAGTIRLIRNDRNLGFVASVNAGMMAAGKDDVVLLNSDTIVPQGWLLRLRNQAYSGERVGTVTPLSNNATICSYPHATGGDMPSGFSLAELDLAAWRANARRSVTIPTAVGFAMFIRRQCLDEVGLFDHETFGLGYGEENDFSLRARGLGWSNILACDTYVYHRGEVSFGGDTARKDRAFKLLTDLHPGYVTDLDEFFALDPVAPYRFRMTAVLLGQTKRDAILHITQDHAGGSDGHIAEIISTCAAETMFLVLQSTQRGCELTVPSLEGHARLHFAPHETQKLVDLLRTFPLTRLHLHRVLGFSFNLRDLIHDLGLPFDVTVHDYLAICPRLTLVKQPEGRYCGEAPEWECNDCIASRPAPPLPVRNIFEHRWKYGWLLTEADRVICPSEDARQRLVRYGFAGGITVANDAGTIAAPGHARSSRQKPIRVGILGNLAAQTGRDLVRQTIVAARGRGIEFVLIGAATPAMGLSKTFKFRETGRYEEQDLTRIIKDVSPDIFWFPAVWPETCSHTLGTALQAGVPIVASELGVFPERLHNVAWARLVASSSSPVEWIDALEDMASWVPEARSREGE